MFNFFDKKFLTLKSKAEAEVRNFMNEERGFDSMVVGIIIIVVCIVVAGVFKDQLLALVNTVFESITNLGGE